MKILLGVCGSISAYRALDVCRGLTKLGHEVRVILTKGAREFVIPETFSYLGAQKVYLENDDFQNHHEAGPVLHISLARWCDRLVVAPLSANTLASFASGGAPDLLTSVFLALKDRPQLIFPAMNEAMLSHPFVQENLQKLAGLPQILIHPTVAGELACGEEGAGKLAPVEEILEVITAFHSRPQKGHVLVVTGATWAPLDPVRYMTNPSTGITGYYMAKEFLAQGYQVTVIAGKSSTPKLNLLTSLPAFTLHRCGTTREVLDLALELLPQVDLYISAAALSDVEFHYSSQKLKKEAMAQALPFTKAPDVLAQVLLHKRPGQKVVGFAAETDLSEQILSEKWQRKPVDLLIGNVVDNGLHGEMRGFAAQEGEYVFFSSNHIQAKKSLTKEALARYLVEWNQSC